MFILQTRQKCKFYYQSRAANHLKIVCIVGVLISPLIILQLLRASPERRIHSTSTDDLQATKNDTAAELSGAANDFKHVYLETYGAGRMGELFDVNRAPGLGQPSILRLRRNSHPLVDNSTTAGNTLEQSSPPESSSRGRASTQSHPPEHANGSGDPLQSSSSEHAKPTMVLVTSKSGSFSRLLPLDDLIVTPAEPVDPTDDPNSTSNGDQFGAGQTGVGDIQRTGGAHQSQPTELTAAGTATGYLLGDLAEVQDASEPTDEVDRLPIDLEQPIVGRHYHQTRREGPAPAEPDGQESGNDQAADGDDSMAEIEDMANELPASMANSMRTDDEPNGLEEVQPLRTVDATQESSASRQDNPPVQQLQDNQARQMQTGPANRVDQEDEPDELYESPDDAIDQHEPTRYTQMADSRAQAQHRQPQPIFSQPPTSLPGGPLVGGNEFAGQDLARYSPVDLNTAAGHHYGKKNKKVVKKKKIVIKKKKKVKIVKKYAKKKVVKKKKVKKHYAPKKHHHDHGHYYMYAKVPKKKSWEFGFKRGNKKHWIERHEKGHKNRFKTKVKWYDKKSKGKGVHIWDYNHHDKKKKHHR